MGSSWGCPGARAPGAHGLLSGRPDPWLSSRWTWTRTRLSGSTTACWSWTRTSGPPSRAQARRADGDTEGPVRPGGAVCHAVPPRLSPPGPQSTAGQLFPGRRHQGLCSRWPAPGPPRSADKVWPERPHPGPRPPSSALAGGGGPTLGTWLCSLPGPGSQPCPRVPCTCCCPRPGGPGAGRRNAAARGESGEDRPACVAARVPSSVQNCLSSAWRWPVSALA